MVTLVGNVVIVIAAIAHAPDRTAPRTVTS